MRTVRLTDLGHSVSNSHTAFNGFYGVLHDENGRTDGRTGWYTVSAFLDLALKEKKTRSSSQTGVPDSLESSPGDDG